MSELTLQVDEDVAQAFENAPNEVRQKIQILFNRWVRDITSTSTRPLTEVMDEISTNAEARGLTPDILESLLKDD